MNFLKLSVTQKLWDIVFAMDSRKKTSTRQKYIAQHLNEYRSSDELLSGWKAVLASCNVHTEGRLLLQKIISAVYGKICEFHSISVRNALSIVETYEEFNSQNNNSLTPVERLIIAYIAGYVYRKTRDKLQRYCEVNKDSQTLNVKEKCQQLAKIAKILSKYVPSIETQPPALSYPNLMTLSLTRGGLTTVGPLDLELFCSLELSIRPFLNIAHFRDSTYKSDAELVEQLVGINTPQLLEKWPYSAQLDHEDNMLLIRPFASLFYRVRKWAYLKVYKEHKKFNETLTHVHQDSKHVDLHGKDSIRKALLYTGVNMQ